MTGANSVEADQRTTDGADVTDQGVPIRRGGAGENVIEWESGDQEGRNTGDLMTLDLPKNSRRADKSIDCS